MPATCTVQHRSAALTVLARFSSWQPAGSGWSQSTLYSFQNGSDGANPAGGLIFDSSGNLYGTTTSKGQGGGGTAFKLTPQQNGTWAFSVLYAFAGQDGGGPQASLAMDAAGNLYGTTYKDGASWIRLGF